MAEKTLYFICLYCHKGVGTASVSDVAEVGPPVCPIDRCGGNQKGMGQVSKAVYEAWIRKLAQKQKEADLETAKTISEMLETAKKINKMLAPAAKRPVVGDLWRRDDIQFPRLLAEIVATQPNLDMAALALAMDLDVSQVDELFERADQVWELSKKTTWPPGQVRGKESLSSAEMLDLIAVGLKAVDDSRFRSVSVANGELMLVTQDGTLHVLRSHNIAEYPIETKD